MSLASAASVELRCLDPFEIRPYSHFASAGDLTYLAPTTTFAVGATVEGRPGGLALAHWIGESASRIVALAVDESLRGQGIGTRLYVRLEQEFLERGIRIADILASCPAPFLEKHGWQKGAPLATVYTFSKKVGEAPWLREATDPPSGYEVFPWLQHTELDRDQILQLMTEDPVARKLNPFTNPGAVFGPASHGIRHNGKLGGWCVTHRVGSSTLQYTSVYVAPRLRRTVASLILLNTSIRAQLSRAGELPFGLQAVPPDLPDIERFAAKRLAPWADQVERMHIWWKQFS